MIELFKKYPWPGNIRELESVLGRAATQVDESGLIALAHLPTSVRHPSFGRNEGGEFNATRPLFEVEHEAILKTAQLCHGNLTRMAQALGVSRTTLWRRIKEYGIVLDQFRQN